jgi:hypothetical protein
MNKEDLLNNKAEVDAYDESQKRIKQYQEMYDEKMAEALGKAFAQYHWVTPQILIPTVLSGQEKMLPEIAKVSAKESMSIGLTPAMMRQNYQKKYVPQAAINW